jgi:uncharacterized membrane protein YcgQ (UPF0703/DUF1980 family)
MKRLLVLIILLALVCGACATVAIPDTDVVTKDDIKITEENSTSVEEKEAENRGSIEEKDAGGLDKEKKDSSTDLLNIVNAAAMDVVEIKEKMFIAQISDILLNVSSYEDKTIKVEGMFFSFFDPYSNREYRYVQRRSPGCCGNDGIVGFEILYDGELPENNDWVEAIGQVKMVKIGEKERVMLQISQLTVKDERGQEFVYN